MLRGPLLDIISLIFKKNATASDYIQVAISVFSVLVVLFLVFPIFEYARGLAAKLMGDDTPERSGMLTLNPFVHIDPMGALVMFICRIGWTKPMPINISNCRKVKPRTAAVLVSLAGPVANILLSYIMVIAYKLVLMSGAGDIAYYIALGLIYTAQISIFLAIIILIPIPPFAGFTILSGFLPRRVVQFMLRYQQIIYWVFLALLVTGALSVPFSFISQGVLWLLDKASFFLG